MEQPLDFFGRFSQAVIDRGAAQGVGREACGPRNGQQRQQAGHGARHLKEEHGAGEGRAHDGREIPRHAEQQEHGHEAGVEAEEVHGAKAVKAADERAQYEQREEDAARRAGGEAQKRAG